MSRIMIAGLGNPGAQYVLTRHNIGFMAIDVLAANFNISLKQNNKVPPHEIGSGIIAGSPVILIKPLTYMNRSGEAVAKALNYYNIPLANLMVIHDDIDIQLGLFKFVKNGGAGGHNGIRSIIDSTGTSDFPRLKIGIGRPPSIIPIDRHVLSSFTDDEMSCLQNVLALALEGVICFIQNGIDAAMNNFNGKAAKL